MRRITLYVPPNEPVGTITENGAIRADTEFAKERWTYLMRRADADVDRAFAIAEQELTGTYYWSKVETGLSEGAESSGFHGHAGREGERGGSLPGEGSSADEAKRAANRARVAAHRARKKAEREKVQMKRTYEPVPQAVEKAREWGTDAIKRVGQMNHLDPDHAVELAKFTLKEWGVNGTVSVRTPLEVAPLVLKDGRWKNQFESGRSQGFLSSSARKEAESNGLGVPHDAPIKERPIYGFLSGIGEREGTADSYGEVEFRLKPEVKLRSTMTVGDSLGMFGGDEAVGTPVLNPDLEGIDSNGTAPVRNDPTAIEYIEVQIQGGLKLSDVKDVVLHVGYQPAEVEGLSEQYRKTYEGLKRAGLKVEVRSGY